MKWNLKLGEKYKRKFLGRGKGVLGRGGYIMKVRDIVVCFRVSIFLVWLLRRVSVKKGVVVEKVGDLSID